VDKGQLNHHEIYSCSRTMGIKGERIFSVLLIARNRFSSWVVDVDVAGLMWKKFEIHFTLVE
jgi:hypothetical protein